MSSPIITIGTAYIAYKAHKVEPFATFGKMCIAYKIFKFLNNICYNWGIDRAVNFVTDPIVNPIAKSLQRSACHLTIGPDGITHTYTYHFGPVTTKLTGKIGDNTFNKEIAELEQKVEIIAKIKALLYTTVFMGASAIAVGGCLNTFSSLPLMNNLGTANDSFTLPINAIY